MVKKENSANGLVNTLCSINADQNENLQVTWVGSDIKVNVVEDITSYTATESMFKVIII